MRGAATSRNQANVSAAKSCTRSGARQISRPTAAPLSPTTTNPNQLRMYSSIKASVANPAYSAHGVCPPSTSSTDPSPRAAGAR